MNDRSVGLDSPRQLIGTPPTFYPAASRRQTDGILSDQCQAETFCIGGQKFLVDSNEPNLEVLLEGLAKWSEEDAEGVDIMTDCSLLEVVSNPSSGGSEYAHACRILTLDLVERALEEGILESASIHAVSAIADYDLVLEPAVHRLRALGYSVKVSCLWPENTVLRKGAMDATHIPLALSQSDAGKMAQLAVFAQSVGTVTELEAILTHVLFDMGTHRYNKIVVFSLVSHVDAERLLKGLLPEPYSGKICLLDHRKEIELALDGRLVPGIGKPSISRAGFDTYAQSRTYVPAVFRSQYDFKKRPKPAAN